MPVRKLTPFGIYWCRCGVGVWAGIDSPTWLSVMRLSIEKIKQYYEGLASMLPPSMLWLCLPVWLYSGGWELLSPNEALSPTDPCLGKWVETGMVRPCGPIGLSFVAHPCLGDLVESISKACGKALSGSVQGAKVLHWQIFCED